MLDAGVGDQDVDAGEPRRDLRDAVLDLFLVGHVHLDPDGLPPQRPRGVLGTLDVGDGHARAFAQVTLGDGAADPAGGASDKGDLPLQPAHSGLFSTRASSPMMPRRKAITQMTKITPWTTCTQEPSWAR